MCHVYEQYVLTTNNFLCECIRKDVMFSSCLLRKLCMCVHDVMWVMLCVT